MFCPWWIWTVFLVATELCLILKFCKGEIGSISSDIKVLQEKSMDMGLKLKNRKVWHRFC